MLDLKEIEADPERVARALSRRGEVPHLDEVLALARDRKTAIQSVQRDQEQRNAVNQQLKGASKDVIDEKRTEMRALSDRVKEGEDKVKAIEADLDRLLLFLPNIPLPDVPDGKDADQNREVKRWGEPKKLAFAAKDHVDIATGLGALDAERAAKISGARFAFLKGVGAKLHRALAHYMIDFHLARGDTELYTPYLVSRQTLTFTGQLPKFEADAFRVPHGEGNDLFLIPTAEVPLTSYFADEILDEEKLPVRFIAHTPCFRAEAGSAGKDTRGLIRQHQFDKVEMVRFATPEQAKGELDAMVGRASDILASLDLPHRVMLLCAGDMGAGAEMTFDLEVWLPSQNTYREISSCSTCGTYQSRRAKIRYRPKDDDGKKAKPRMLHTLNGSGLAVGRTWIALLENHQQADGSVVVPEKLRPYLGGMEKLVPSSA